MATILDTINPVAVGTNVNIKSTFALNPAPDWLEVANDSPYQMNVYAQGNLNSPIMILTPFETNGYPINQLIPAQIGLKIIAINLVLIASHYYSDPATENNSPTNICIVRQLSNAEAQTNHYPVYSSRMNTTVAVIANSVVNTGLPPGTDIVSGQPVNDTSNSFPTVLTNSGVLELGDATYNALIALQGTDGNTTVIDNDHVQSNQGSFGEVFFTIGSVSRLALVGDTTIANAGTSVAHGLGAIPDFVIPVIDHASASSDVIDINYATMTNTHFTAYSSNAGGTVNVRFFLIKF